MRCVTTLASIRAALDSFRGRRLPEDDNRRWAAVAAVLRDTDSGAEVLMIRRADDPLDPWSGHMAFPGGRVDPDDVDPLHTAVRETFEEVGLDLAREGRLLGRLSDIAAVGRGRPMGFVIAPYVFEIEAEPELRPNYEVAEALWVPVDFLRDRRNLSTVDWRHGDAVIPLPCCRFHGRVIWGLTYAMVAELVSVIG
jgi:8-oxo-dGTP pyrophosphatase MutT (NUDIX family)